MWPFQQEKFLNLEIFISRRRRRKFFKISMIFMHFQGNFLKFFPISGGAPFPPWCHVWARISPCAHLAGFRLRFLFLSNFSILKKSRRIPVLSPHCTCVNYQFFNLVSCKQRRIEKWNFLSAHVSTSFSRNFPSEIVSNSPSWKALDVVFVSWSINNLEWHHFYA